MDDAPEDPKLTELKRVVDALWPDHRDSPTDKLLAVLEVINETLEEHQYHRGPPLRINECSRCVRLDLEDEEEVRAAVINGRWYCAQCSYQCNWCGEHYLYCDYDHEAVCDKRPRK